MKGKNGVAAFLAIVAMVGFLGIFYLLTFKVIPPENKDFFNMGFIALIGFVGTAFGYYLGSSLGSAQKTALLGQAERPPVPDIPAAAIPAIPPPPQPWSVTTGGDQAGYILVRFLMGLTVGCLLIMLCLGVFGCATTGKQETPQSIAAKSLLTTRQAIIATATTADSLCAQGYLQQDDCTRASYLYIQAQAAYAVASDAFLVYLTAGDAASRQAYDKAFPPLASLFTDLDSLVKTVKTAPEGGKL
jgi:hypothetical protein